MSESAEKTVEDLLGSAHSAKIMELEVFRDPPICFYDKSGKQVEFLYLLQPEERERLEAFIEENNLDLLEAVKRYGKVEEGFWSLNLEGRCSTTEELDQISDSGELGFLVSRLVDALLACDNEEDAGVINCKKEIKEALGEVGTDTEHVVWSDGRILSVVIQEKQEAIADAMSKAAADKMFPGEE